MMAWLMGGTVKKKTAQGQKKTAQQGQLKDKTSRRSAEEVDGDEQETVWKDWGTKQASKDQGQKKTAQQKQANNKQGWQSAKEGGVKAQEGGVEFEGGKDMAEQES